MKFSHFEKPDCNVIELTGKDGIYYWLQEAVLWYSQDGIKHIVPAYMLSDGYSVPKCLWGIIRGLNSRQPAYLHDYLYRIQICSRNEADIILRDAIIQTGGGKYTAWKVYIGLWIGGWVAWNHHKKQIQQTSETAVLSLSMAATIEDAREKALKGIAA